MCEKFLPTFERVLTESGSGFMLPSGISYADFVVAALMPMMKGMEPEIMSKYTKMLEYADRVLGQSQLKEYMTKKGKQ